jgi:lipopolysaccharide biosynthesis glycosyltransferase
MEKRGTLLYDVISDAPMSTEHACARFLVKELAGSGWALFMDGDVLVRGNLARLFEALNPQKAVYCVHHRHEPEAATKMDGQIQTRYARKNWSSVMAVNCDHPANRALTVEMINTVPGRDLHAFCWLEDGDIGELGPEWNYLVGVTTAKVEPQIAHFTLGVPDMTGWEDQPYAEEWRGERLLWAA